MKSYHLRLRSLEENNQDRSVAQDTGFSARREFHIRKEVRDRYNFDASLFALSGNVLFTDFRAVRDFASKLNAKVNPLLHPERRIQAGRLNAMGLIDEILHYVCKLYAEQKAPNLFSGALKRLDSKFGSIKVDLLLKRFLERFPPVAVYRGEDTIENYLKNKESGESQRAVALEELVLLKLANMNPAFEPYAFLFDENGIDLNGDYKNLIQELQTYFKALPPFGPDNHTIWDLLRSPAVEEPYSLTGQLEYIRTHWGLFLGKYLLRMLTSLDVVKEEEKPVFFGPGPTRAYVYSELEQEYERFSPDQDWMPRTVLIAKSTLVWLSQLSKKYGKGLSRLDEIPEAELDELASRGFTGLWLIGLWERSPASREIKRRCGNNEAAASAYSLYDYDIAQELGGWPALETLRDRCAWRGIHLASDMVPNHTGIDSRWIIEHPDRFVQLKESPFPAYSFNGGKLADRDDIGIYLEDHYYEKTDAAVVFKRVDFRSGETRYMYHGNDGTSMPWNDTAQIDFLNPQAREAVIDTIVAVCKQFHIVRFDAAMTLAKKHIQRLWYPEPGSGGDIASRSEHGLPSDEFNRLMPNEFWREVVDRCAKEAPDTLLLAEAFWMMEGYFVRTLGMHRVYNSAFMNMLKAEENAKYRATILNTLEFDHEILKRFVNFMNNPDEETAVAQFGKGDKYFGVCTLMVTMPGLPMFGHGQIEGFEEKYGMEYRKAYREEAPDTGLIHRHEHEIFPLLKKRYLFSGSDNFALFDLIDARGTLNENVFAYSNHSGGERALVVYNNAYARAEGHLQWATASIPKGKAEGKHSVRKNLVSALDLGDCGGAYIFFREQRSGLWFIRDGNTLSQEGLFVSLDGYQCQVFLDIHSAEDDAERHYGRLCEALGGSGVHDIQAAIQDLFLEDLYSAFNKLADRAYFDGLAELMRRPVTTKDIASFLEACRPAFDRFVSVADQYLTGALGDYGSFPRDEEAAALDKASLFAAFSDQIDGFARLLTWIDSDTAAFVAEDLGLNKAGTAAPTKELLRQLRSDLLSSPYLFYFIAGHFIFSILRPLISADATGEEARRLIDHWCLDRKLRERLADFGVEPGIGFRLISLLKIAASLLPPESALAIGAAITAAAASGTSPSSAALAAAGQRMKDPKLGLLSQLTRILANEEVKSFLGVHIFDGVLWFNKERFSEALALGTWIALAESRQAAESQTRKQGPQKPSAPRSSEKARWAAVIEEIINAYTLLRAGEAAAGYHYDKLGEAVLAAAAEPKR